MRVALTAEDILEVAIETERHGATFYDRLSGTAGNADLKQQSERLAEMERDHEKTFRHILAQRDVQRAIRSMKLTGKPDEDQQYISALVETNMLPDEDAACRLAEECETDMDAIDTALQLEKNTILFYREAQEMLESEDEDIDRILSEERSHVRQLNEMKQDLQER